MAFPGGINHVVHVVAKAFSTEIVTTLQVRYLRYGFLLVAYVTLEVLLVAFEELSVNLLHSPLLIILLSIHFIESFFLTLVKGMLPLHPSLWFLYHAMLERMEVFIVLDIGLIANIAEQAIFLIKLLFRVYVKAMSESFKGNMFFFLKPMLSYCRCDITSIGMIIHRMIDIGSKLTVCIPKCILLIVIPSVNKGIVVINTCCKKREIYRVYAPSKIIIAF